jgi:hypothetical protein
MKEKLSPQEETVESGATESPKSQVVRKTREVAGKAMAKEAKVQREFLRKYHSESVLVAVQMDGHAACEFMDHLREKKAFGNLSKMQIRDAVLKAVECDHNAADAFIKNAKEFKGVLDPGGFRDALLIITFRHVESKLYFMGHFEAEFSRLPGAEEVFEELDRAGSKTDRGH